MQLSLLIASLVCLSTTVNTFQVTNYGRALFFASSPAPSSSSSSSSSVLRMSDDGEQPKGVNFNYNPANFKDSNSGNYRRLSDQLAAAKYEEEKLQKEAEEIERKEKMLEMLRQKESDIFFNTPPDKVVASSDKFFVQPEILQVIADLDKELIGLKPVKEQMRQLASLYMVNRIRDSLGLPVEKPMLNHIFTGNPGTGKTTVAMKLGELYKAMGYVATGHTIVASRAELVGQYIGHTGPKTKELMLRSFGGILFIDEAYGLYKGDPTARDYGNEVLEQLIKFMDSTDEAGEFVVVMAGYKDLMQEMLQNNLKLMVRMGNWIDFPDYNNPELLEISSLLARNYGYDYPPAAQNKFVEFMNLRKEFPWFSNARTVRNAMERARRVAANRIMVEGLSTGSDYHVKNIFSYDPKDFQYMIDEIIHLPRNESLP